VNKTLVFAYFKGHGDGLHLAYSNDAYKWSALMKDDILLRGTVGKEKIMRDPCIIRGADGTFHLVWTCGWNEQGIGYSSSTDLITWSPGEFLPVMAHEPKARNCWAPEIFYDDAEEHFIIYWASTVDGKFPETQPFGDDGYNHRMYFVTTKDFRKFSETRLLYDGGFNVIDATILKDGERYLMFMKDETLTPAKKHLRMAYGPSPLAFGEAGPALTPNHYWAEGPTAVKFNAEWLVYFDKYKLNEIGAIRSRDLEHWEDISHLVHFPEGAQHGSVFVAPAAVIEPLKEHRRTFAGRN
jgi:beta-xylosidase